MRPEEYRNVIKSLEIHYQEFMRNSLGSEMFGDEDKRKMEMQYAGAQSHYDQLVIQLPSYSKTLTCSTHPVTCSNYYTGLKLPIPDLGRLHSITVALQRSLSFRGKWNNNSSDSGDRWEEGGDGWEDGQLGAECQSHDRPEDSQTQTRGSGVGLDSASPCVSEGERCTAVLPKTCAAAGTTTHSNISTSGILCWNNR